MGQNHKSTKYKSKHDPWWGNMGQNINYQNISDTLHKILVQRPKNKDRLASALNY